MLAKSPPGYLLTLSCVIVLIASSLSQAQQPPSSRYQPAGAVGYRFSDQSPQATVPPSVHIPPSTTAQLNSQAMRPGVPQRPAVSGSHGQAPHSNLSESNMIPSERGLVRQTSFNQDPTKPQEPTVPEILQRSNRLPATPAPTSAPPVTSNESGQPRILSSPTRGPADLTPPANLAARSPAVEGSALPASKPLNPNPLAQSPADFASQMSQLRPGNSGNAPESDRVAQMKQDFERLQQRAAERAQLVNATGDNRSDNGASPIRSEVVGSIPLSASSHSASPELARDQASYASRDTLDKTFSNFLGSESKPTATQPASPSLTPSSTAAQPTARVLQESVRDFMTGSPASGASDAYDPKSPSPSPLTASTDDRIAPAAMQVPIDTNDEISGNPSVRNFDEPSIRNSALRLSAPSISVESFGPQSISMNKPAVYKVVVTNETNRAAERIVVSIDVPAWVEMDKVNLTAGERQVSDGKQQARMIWKIDQIPGNGSQTATITAIPRKAEAFDLGIEWTIAPRSGTASIQVTQPKLEMSIVGPEEVQFGETAPYEVTVRNAGNGDAENVVVMLSEALNGERGNLGNIPAGSAKSFTVNLFARTPGELELGVSAVSDNQAEAAVTRKLVIRRASLGISIVGPSLRYAGTQGQYTIKLTNNGDAAAEDVVAALGLPSGVKFLGGIETFKLIEGGLRWQVGRLEPGQAREYKVTCQLDTAGDLQLEVGTQGKGALQASHACVTRVQTIADLVMQVNDPPGPLTTGDEITYEIIVQNRGTKAAKSVDIFMILSDGMEPKSGSGLEYRIPRDGALQFATIPQIEPGQKIALKVNAVAYKPGTHVFRAHMVCEEADAREIKEGTSKFFGDEVNNPLGNHPSTADEKSNFNNSDFQSKLK